MPTLNRLNPIARALLVRHAIRKPRFFASAGLAMMLPAVAAQAQDVAFNIPAQALGSALTEFGKQANVEVLYSPELVNGQRSNGLRGTFSTDQGIAQLLRGTAVSYSLQGTSLILTPVGNGSALELGPTNVNGVGLGSTTESTRSYTTGTMQTATKLALSLKETPQSATVITRQRIQDQQMNTLDDVVKNTPGLVLQKLGNDRPFYYARGNTIDNRMFDGVPTNVGSNASDPTDSPDLAMYDHIEVVRGATGLMQGVGNPSASINMVRKKPTATPEASISVSGGSWDRYRSEVDVSGPLTESGNVRGRLVTAYQNYKSFQDVARNERGLFYGVLAGDLTDDTTLTVGASRQNDNSTATWGGIPVAANGSDLHLPRSTFLGNDWDSWNKLSEMAFANLEHRFDSGWKLNVSANKTWSSLDQAATKAIDPNYNNVFTQRLANLYYTNQQSGYDAYASGPFELFGREHELVVGASKYDEKYMYKGAAYSALATNMDIFNWDHSLVPKNVGPQNDNRQVTQTEQKSLYSTARLKILDPLTLIIGSRLDWYEYDTWSRYGLTSKPSASDFKVTRNITKYAGLVYDINDTYAVYASYTDIFKPQNYLGTGGSLLTPILGKNYEVGIKGAYFDGALNASAAVFRMNQENRAKRVSDQTQCASYSASITCYEAAGVVRSEGIDLEIQGSLTPSWQIGGGYTYTETKYVKDTTKSNEGSNFDTDLPTHLLKLTTSYTLPGTLDKWRVGGSFYRQSKMYNKGSTFYMEQQAYNVTDLMVGFNPTAHIETQLNLNNVFDKRYYMSITDDPGRAENIYGDPRNMMFSVKYKF